MTVYATDGRLTVEVDAEDRDSWGDHAYIGYVADCFDPYKVVVRGDNDSDAYDWLLCHPHIEAACKVDVADPYFVADYGHTFVQTAEAVAWEAVENGRLTVNDNGVMLDTESVDMFGPVTFKIGFAR